MKELVIIIKDQQTGKGREEVLEIEDNALAKAVVDLALNNTYDDTRTGVMEIARALDGTRPESKKIKS